MRIHASLAEFFAACHVRRLSEVKQWSGGSFQEVGWCLNGLLNVMGADRSPEEDRDGEKVGKIEILKHLSSRA